MTFEYFCKYCKLEGYDVQAIGKAKKSIKCVSCGKRMQRIFSVVCLSKTGVQSAEYNPAFGCVINNKQHAQELAKRNGMVEIGNETPKKLEKMQEDHIKSVQNRDYED